MLGRRGWWAIAGYLAVWGASTAYIGATGGDWTFPIVSLTIFGVALSALAWFLTRKMDAPAVPVARPKHESLALLAYLVIYAVLLIGVWLGSIKRAIPAGQTQELAVLGYKLLIHVGVPAAIVLLIGGTLGPLFDPGVRRRGFWPALIVLSSFMFALLAAVSPSLKQLDALGLTPAVAIGFVMASWAWVSLEAGVCEEFLFRACIQSRLTAWFQSPAAAIAVTSVLFALSHWPGLYLRGGPGVDGWSPDPVQVAAFTIATLSPLAVSLGLLWVRSRSFLLIVLVHGAIDALPHAAEFARIWG
jgi:membrane protease YdiL (CAAX protease family)